MGVLEQLQERVVGGSGGAHRGRQGGKDGGHGHHEHHGHRDSRNCSKTPPSCKELSYPPSLASFDDVTERLEMVEKMQISGRYHRRPKTLSSDYEVSETVLGSGINGDVRLSNSKIFPQHRFAVKAFNFAGIPDAKRQQLESEVEVFLQMDHPHIARLMDVYESDEHLDLVMECMDGGELFERVKKKKRFSEPDAAEATYQMLLALNYLHEHGIMHGDVKLENWMYDDNDHLKLIDFGFSNRVGSAATKKACGTLSYIAPEVLDFDSTDMSDQWSLGVVVFIMLSGYMPFSGTEEDQMIKISEGRYTMAKERWMNISPDGVDFVRRLLRVKPTYRMSAERALEHPFIVKMHHAHHPPPVIDTSVIEALRDWGYCPRFRRCCYEMMAWVLTNEERSKVEDYFLAMDCHHHGAITYDDLKRIMVDKFHVPDKEVKRAFHALDAHHDGEIHYSDFLAAMISCGQVHVCEDHFRETFRKFDSHEAGYITADNLREVWGDNIDGQSVERMFREVDVEASGRISYHQFASYMNTRPGRGWTDEEPAESPVTRGTRAIAKCLPKCVKTAANQYAVGQATQAPEPKRSSSFFSFTAVKPGRTSSKEARDAADTSGAAAEDAAEQGPCCCLM